MRMTQIQRMARAARTETVTTTVMAVAVEGATTDAHRRKGGWPRREAKRRTRRRGKGRVIRRTRRIRRRGRGRRVLQLRGGRRRESVVSSRKHTRRGRWDRIRRKEESCIEYI